MKAMILAAGLGTRLKPITDTRPKALVEINGKTLLEHTILNLKKSGFNEIVVNVHHFSNQVIEYLKEHNNFGCNIQISDESDLLLDTGGGVKKASQYFDNQPVLIHNVDVITNIDIAALVKFHEQQSDAIATLAVKKRSTSRSFLIDCNKNLAGWRNNQTGETKISHGKISELTDIAFSCVYILNPEFITLMYETGVFSITDVFLRLAQNQRIATFDHSQDVWMDLGRIEHLQEAEKALQKMM
jgi:NDP-sugar pyrophosphorylase family protein